MNCTAARPGFTLLEVMIAIAILATALAALFSSEVGAVRLSVRARQTTTASLLARCKMGEIEEQMLKEGLPAVETHETDDCCEGAETEGFECEWRVERIELPEMSEEETTDPLAALAGQAEAQPRAAGENAVSPIDRLLAADAPPPGDMIAELALSYTYPILKPVIEEQVRRATVKVRWHEGNRASSFDVTQFLVAEQVNLPEEP